MELLYTNEKGDLLVARNLKAAACRGEETLLAADFIPMPEGATLISLPQRIPLGINSLGKVDTLDAPGWPVAALLPQGFTRTMLPAYEKPQEVATEVLPLMGYTAVAMAEGKPLVAAIQSEDPQKWQPEHFNTPDLFPRIQKVKRLLPRNRIIGQLAHCALSYRCFTAQNIFYRRWEGGLPVSRFCNARCLGCISQQESQCCPAPQSRLAFRPRVKEIVEVAVFHLSGKGGDNIISFGQGCEGEPSLEAELISKSIKTIRRNTEAGLINMNTNGGHSGCIEEIVNSGLDMMRVSLFSAIPEHYAAYYRPKAYTLQDVEKSIRYSVDKGVYVSLNLLTFPGYTDREAEVEALLAFIKRTGLQKVQLRNLNFDCDYFYTALGLTKEKSLGIGELIRLLTAAGVEVGSYSTPKE